MDIRPIRTEADYDWALAEAAPYFENEPPLGSPEGDRFEVLVSLIEAYEARRWPIEAPDPVDTIAAVMEMRGLKQKDLALMVGSRSRASEIMNRKRALTLDMVHRLNTEWNIPAEVLVKPYHLEERREQAD